MTVYPLIFNLGPLTISGYGIMLAVGFITAGWVIQLDLRRRKLNEEYAWDIVLWAAIGGVAGAKLWYVALTGDPSRLFSPFGFVWYGGFVGGFLGVFLNGLRRRVPTKLTFDLSALGLAVGYALGRVGCFLVQDDYGLPTSLPWAMRFPQGSPPSTAQIMSTNFGVPIPDGSTPFDVLAVHPTQLYEVAAMLFVFWLLWRLRNHTHGTGWLFGLYLLLAGTERFLIEFLRAKDDRFFGAFTLAQMFSLVVATAGVALMTRWFAKDELRIPEQSVLSEK